MAAFTALAQAVKDIELSLAYAIWGGFGILATVAMGWALFGQRLAWRGWLGLLLLLAGMSLLAGLTPRRPTKRPSSAGPRRR